MNGEADCREYHLTRQREERKSREERRLKAWDAARRAAELLRVRFGATRVRLFGSSLHPGQFFAPSDIDLLADGIGRESYLSALGALQSVDAGFEIDLVVAGISPREVVESAAKEGIDL